MLSYIKNLFRGRINRLTFLVGNSIILFMYLILYFIFRDIINGEQLNILYYIVVIELIFLFQLIFTMSLRVRRLHDIGKPGKWAFPDLAWYRNKEFVGGKIIPLIFWPFIKGEDGTNEYGQKPKDGVSLLQMFGFKQT